MGRERRAGPRRRSSREKRGAGKTQIRYQREAVGREFALDFMDCIGASLFFQVCATVFLSFCITLFFGDWILIAFLAEKVATAKQPLFKVLLNSPQCFSFLLFQIVLH